MDKNDIKKYSLGGLVIRCCLDQNYRGILKLGSNEFPHKLFVGLLTTVRTVCYRMARYQYKRETIICTKLCVS